jgi:asparagine synthase (glutamine-hydrolysing)
MTGIIGIVDKHSIDLNLWNEMIQKITYDPKYRIDEFQKDNFGLARTHLGIIPSSQPIFNEDKTLCFMIEGEVFNTKSEDDLKYCMNLYEQGGIDALYSLNGAFNLVILNLEKETCTIVNDRYGLRPLHYYVADDKLLFASEVKALINAETQPLTLDERAFADFFTFGFVVGNKTFFNEIRLLPPASILIWDKGKTAIRKYWDCKYKEESSCESIDYYVERLEVLLKQAVERRMKGKHKFGVSLSGGLDSRIILSSIDKKHYPISTITFAFPDIDNTPRITKEIAKVFGTNHVQLQISKDFLEEYAEKAVFLTDGLLNLGTFHSISILDDIANSADVVLDGWECETNFKGKYLLPQWISARNDDELCKAIYKRIQVIGEDERSQLLSPEWQDKVKNLASQSIQKEIKKSENKLFGNKGTEFVFRNTERTYLNRTFVYRRSRYIDRKPYLDNDLVDFALTIPMELRRKRRVYDQLIKKIVPAKAQIRDDHYKAFTNPILTFFFKIINKLFSLGNDYPQYGDWIRTNSKLENYVRRILLDKKTSSRPYFNPLYVEQMLNEHINQKRDHTKLILTLLTFELWHRQFFD